nr:hypothetical protein [Tanacetum cinerariifolium]
MVRVKIPREVSSFDEPEPQPNPLPNSPSLNIVLGDEGGPEPPIKPHSLNSFRMKVVDNLTIHTPPSTHMASFYSTYTLNLFTYLNRRFNQEHLSSRSCGVNWWLSKQPGPIALGIFLYK